MNERTNDKDNLSVRHVSASRIPAGEISSDLQPPIVTTHTLNAIEQGRWSLSSSFESETCGRAADLCRKLNDSRSLPSDASEEIQVFRDSGHQLFKS